MTVFGVFCERSLKGPWLVLAIGMLVAGCTPSIRGTPERLFTVATETEFARSMSGLDAHIAYAQSTGVRRREIRDQIVLSRMYAADIYYSEYEAKLTRERQDIGFLSTVANLALTSSATLIAVNETKSILSAVATGLTGAREAYEKDILIEKTIAILQQQMRARRKEIKTVLLQRLALNTDAYPLELALTDLEAYYRAGTITGALIDVAEETGARLATARDIEQNIVITRYAPPTDLGERINRYARASAANKEKIEKWLADNNVGVSPVAFLRPAYRSLQAQMIRDLGIP